MIAHRYLTKEGFHGPTPGLGITYKAREPWSQGSSELQFLLLEKQYWPWMLMFMLVSSWRSLRRTWLASLSHLASWANVKSLGNKISLCVWLPYKLVCFHPSVVLQGYTCASMCVDEHTCAHICTRHVNIYLNSHTHTHTISGNDIELCPTYLKSLSPSLSLHHN